MVRRNGAPTRIDSEQRDQGDPQPHDPSQTLLWGIPTPHRIARGSAKVIDVRDGEPTPGFALVRQPQPQLQPQPQPQPQAARSWIFPAQLTSLARRSLVKMKAIKDRRPSSVGRWLVLASVAVLATASTVAGSRMWRAAHQPQLPLPAGVAALGHDRLELAPNRRAITRIGPDGTRWTSTQPAAVDTMEITGPLVLGRTSGTLVAVDRETGTTRFAWELPAGERWSAAPPVVVESCFTTLTIRGGDALLRCFDPASGAPRWTANIASGQDCVGPPVAIPGAYLLQCPGWTTVIDDRTGAASVEAGGLGLVQREPPMLLRSRTAGRLVMAAWNPKQRRFGSGTAVRGTVETPTSAIQRGDRLIVRASSASEDVATILQKSGAPVVLTLPELQLADDAPLTSDCDLGAAPRFQLVELAPRAGTTFDPELARMRVLALIDIDAGRVAWTSRRIAPPRRADASPFAVCKHGHYFVPLASGLWILDATTGQTRATLGTTGPEASFVDLTRDQIEADALVGMSSTGPFSLAWRRPGDKLPAGIEDARATIEGELGHLP